MSGLTESLRRGGLLASSFDDRNDLPSTSALEPAALLVERSASPISWTAIIDDLLALRLLEDDWDGQGAKAPSTALVDSAIVLSQLFRRQGCLAPSRVVAGVNGTVILEWQADESYFEIEVTTPYEARATRMTPGQPSEEWDLSGGNGA